MNRRRAIRRLLAPVPIVWSLPYAASAAQSKPNSDLRVDTSAGPINSATLGDFAIYSAPAGAKRKTKTLLLTSAKRDLIGGALSAADLEVVVPKSEAHYFTKPEAFWELFQETRFHDYDARATKWPAAALTATKISPVAEGDHVHNVFTVVDTPGFTRGSISYLTVINDRKYAFTGDLISGDGQIDDLYSLQDGITDVSTSTRVAGRNTVRGYHGFAARASDLMTSLTRIRDAKPDVIVPAHGPVITKPQAAIDRLLGRLQTHLREHFSTDALRWYWGDDNLIRRAAKMSIRDLAWMDMAETRKLPDWIIPIQNSKLILSTSGGAFLVDCGYERVYDEVEKLRQQGKFQKLEGIYVTHYHDDHTDFVAEAARRAGDVPVYFVDQIRDVLEKPHAYRLPAMTRNPILKGEAMAEGSRKSWHEYEMEFAYFPGQTLYHGVMVLTHTESGTRIVFGGDSFTPSGIDDYCLLNRNLTGENEGYLYCLRYLRKLGPGVFLTNQHVEPMWTYTTAQMDRMEESLRKRTAILKDLFPWDSPNYGIDEQWVRFYPYGIEAKPGATVELEVRITNHSPVRSEFTVRPSLPAGWKVASSKPTIPIDTGADGSATFSIRIPDAAKEGLTILTADVESGESMRFPAFVEAMVRVKA